MAGAVWQVKFDDEEVERALGDLANGELRKLARGALEDMGTEIASNAAFKQMIRGGGTGRGKKDAPPHPSRLTSRDGYLRKSITSQLESGLTLEVGSNWDYARIHELGDPSRHMPKRAYLAPALGEEEGSWAKLFARRWQKEATRRGL